MKTEQRLARLERENRIIKAAVGVLALVVAAAFLIGAGSGQEKPDVLNEVRARAFYLVGANGGCLACLEPDTSGFGTGARLCLLDDARAERLELRTGGKDGHTELRLQNHGGDSGCRIGAAGLSSLTLRSKGQRRFVVRDGQMTMTDKEGRNTFLLANTPDGSFLTLMEPGTAKGGGVTLGLDRSESSRSMSIRIFDERGKLVHKVP